MATEIEYPDGANTWEVYKRMGDDRKAAGTVYRRSLILFFAVAFLGILLVDAQIGGPQSLRIELPNTDALIILLPLLLGLVMFEGSSAFGRASIVDHAMSRLSILSKGSQAVYQLTAPHATVWSTADDLWAIGESADPKDRTTRAVSKSLGVVSVALYGAVPAGQILLIGRAWTKAAAVSVLWGNVAGVIGTIAALAGVSIVLISITRRGGYIDSLASLTTPSERSTAVPPDAPPEPTQ